jgi:proteasomal ATPase-associated factor 1
MVPPITLPVVTVQHDMLDVISDVDSGAAAMEDVWVSCYKAGEPSIHGKVRVSLDEADSMKGRVGQKCTTDAPNGPGRSRMSWNELE